MNKENSVLYGTLSLILLVLSACASAPPPYTAPGRDLWAPFNQRDTLHPDYGLYTYLLMRDSANSNPTEEAFFREILQQAEGLGYDSTAHKEQFNLFAIPVFKEAGLFRYQYESLYKNERLPFVMDDYNDDLAKQIMGYLSVNTEHKGIRKRLQENGPFLVSVSEPLDVNTNNNITILLFDGSDISPEMVPHVIKRYCDYIHHNEIEKEKVFRDFSIYLGDFLVRADDHILLFLSLKDNLESGDETEVRTSAFIQ